jgi:hypothetical protein
LRCGAADLLDDPHVLVAEDHAFVSPRAALVHVQVRAADAARREAQDHVVRVLDDDGVIDVLDLHLIGAAVDQCFHGVLAFDRVARCRLATLRHDSDVQLRLPEGVMRK